MEAKEKAQQLVDKFKDYVHGYVGSSMLTNHEYPEQILAQAKKVAIIAVDEIINNCPFRDYGFKFDSIDSRLKAADAYWQQVKIEINNL